MREGERAARRPRRDVQPAAGHARIVKRCALSVGYFASHRFQADGRVRFAMATARKSASGVTGVRIITRQGRFQDIAVAAGATIRLQVLGGSLAYQTFPVEALNGKLRAYAAATQPRNGSTDKEAALDKVGLRVSFDDRGRATAITEIAHD